MIKEEIIKQEIMGGEYLIKKLNTYDKDLNSIDTTIN